MIKFYRSTTPEKLKNEEFSFETIHNMNILKLEKCQSVRTAMKAWNGCIQYWMGVYVYKRFPMKRLRTIVTLALSAVWHGWAPGYFFCICQIPLFMLTDDIAMKFYHQSEENSLAKKAWYMLLWYEKTTCMAYLGMSFLLLGFHETMHYYKAVYFSGHVVALLLYITVLCLKPYVLKRTAETKDKEK